MSTISVIQPYTCRSCKIYEICDEELTRETNLVLTRFHKIFHRRAALWQVSDNFLGIYILCSGSAKSFAVSKEGDEHITKFHFTGDLLGLDGFNNVYKNTIEFLETSSVRFISANDIDVMMKHSADFRNRLLKSMSIELVNHCAMSLSYNTHTSKQRLAAFLIELSASFGKRGESRVEFMLSMTQNEIANYLGMAMETVSRVLGKFQAFGFIELNQRKIKINNIVALNDCLDGGGCAKLTVVHNND